VLPQKSFSLLNEKEDQAGKSSWGPLPTCNRQRGVHECVLVAYATVCRGRTEEGYNLWNLQSISEYGKSTCYKESPSILNSCPASSLFRHFRIGEECLQILPDCPPIQEFPAGKSRSMGQWEGPHEADRPTLPSYPSWLMFYFILCKHSYWSHPKRYSFHIDFHDGMSWSGCSTLLLFLGFVTRPYYDNDSSSEEETLEDEEDEEDEDIVMVKRPILTPWLCLVHLMMAVQTKIQHRRRS